LCFPARAYKKQSWGHDADDHKTHHFLALHRSKLKFKLAANICLLPAWSSS
jgi:hypothetical protein